ncbi:Mur ligase family protein [Candidatus Bipolaricaulota bacterium]
MYVRIPRIVWNLANLYRTTLAKRVRIVAIVGSFGKTTTTRAVLAALGFPDSRRRGWNSGIGLADAILRIRPWDQHAVIEVAIGGKGEMEGFARLLRPDIAVATCIGSEHLSSLGTLEVTRAEKAKMISAVSSSGLVILNGDDSNVLWMKEFSSAQVVTYGFGESNQVRATDVVDNELSGVRFNLHIDGAIHEVRTHLIGRHMIYPILAAITVARFEGCRLDKTIAALGELEATPNRLQAIDLPSGALLLLDAYKSALETIEVALDTLSRLPANRKILVLGEVEEPPDSQGIVYRALGELVASTADHVIFVGGRRNLSPLRTGATAGGLPRDALMSTRTDPHAVVQALESIGLDAGDIVLIKGRSTQHLERVALILSGQTVTCAARLCSRRHDCATCPLLRSKASF